MTSNAGEEILVTGGTGYVGSHTCVALIQAGHRPVVLDNLSNSSSVVLERIERITGHRPAFYKADLRDRAAMTTVFREHDFTAVIHFAGLKAVGESVRQPLRYYENNVNGSVSLFQAMAAAGVKRIIFSSSATIYGEAQSPIPETAPIAPTNPYGWTKAIVERILQDLADADGSWQIGLLRYFNPVGAHESGLIGEDPQGVPENLVPFIAQVAIGRRAELQIFGNDYPTTDGTGVRDYIHVMDLAEGHLAALAHLVKSGKSFSVNLGTGHGHSVLEVVRAFEKTCGKPIARKIVSRRPGDVAVSYADPTKAQTLLGWRASRGLEKMCEDVWRWQKSNPTGYRT